MAIAGCVFYLTHTQTGIDFHRVHDVQPDIGGGGGGVTTEIITVKLIFIIFYHLHMRDAEFLVPGADGFCASGMHRFCPSYWK